MSMSTVQEALHIMTYTPHIMECTYAITDTPSHPAAPWWGRSRGLWATSNTEGKMQCEGVNCLLGCDGRSTGLRMRSQPVHVRCIVHGICTLARFPPADAPSSPATGAGVTQAAANEGSMELLLWSCYHANEHIKIWKLQYTPALRFCPDWVGSSCQVQTLVRARATARVSNDGI